MSSADLSESQRKDSSVSLSNCPEITNESLSVDDSSSDSGTSSVSLSSATDQDYVKYLTPRRKSTNTSVYVRSLVRHILSENSSDDEDQHEFPLRTDDHQ